MDDVPAAPMEFSPDLARSIERMLSKLDAADKATFNECVFMARGFRGSFESQLAGARRQAVEEVSAWLTHKRGCMAKYVLADGRHCTCDCGLAALFAESGA